MRLAQYPDFEPLDSTHKPLFDAAFLAHPPVISEFTFTNLYTWRDAYKFKIAGFAGAVIIVSETKAGRQFFLPAGSGAPRQIIEKVLDDAPAVFARIPENIARACAQRKGIRIEHDPANDDYLYRTDELVNLAGRKYDGKRNFIRRFRAQRAYEYVDLHASHIPQCLAFKEKWCLLRDCDGVESLRNEKKAVREMILNCEEFGLIGGAVRVSGEIVAMAIGERLNPDTLVIHVLKAHADMPGLYQTMLNEFLSRRGGPFAWVNMEQDLGVEGLRKAKLSYHPAHMVRKFIVTRASI